ncbi:MAG: GNAT family N-acetyltransferase, partial [Burkholderiaceae bacterium]
MFDPASIPLALRSAYPPIAARIEDAALTASQPRQQTFYDGWLLRHSPGKARRARSVNTLAAGALPLAEKIAYSEVFYAQNDLPCIYRITPL